MSKNLYFLGLFSTALALAPVCSADSVSSKLVIRETKQDNGSSNTWDKNGQNQNRSDNGNQIDPPSNNAQGEIEQAAESFDAFALLMPKVIEARFQAFMTHGFKAVLLPNNEEESNETRMIDALIRGLQALGNSLAQDMPQKSQPFDEQHTTEKQIRARH
jgi:predicted restriction endonuclease